MTRRAVFNDAGVLDDGIAILGTALPDPSAEPDGHWLRTASGAAVWQAATTADLPASTNKRYVTDAQLVVLGNTSGTNSGDQTTVSGNAGTATKLATARNIDGQAFDGTANITVVAPATHAATGKTTPVDADELALVDSAAANVLKKLTWLNLKATLKTYFDTLYAAAGGGSGGVIAHGSYSGGNRTSTGATFAAGTDLLTTALSFTADGSSDYLVRIAAASIRNDTNACGSILEFNFDGAETGTFVQVLMTVANQDYPCTGAVLAAAPSAGAHTVNARLRRTFGGTATVTGGNGSGSNFVPIVLTVEKLA